MLIHVVKPGDTVYSIALGVRSIPSSQLILDNGLETSSRLAVGQALVVQFPTQTHTVQPRETLASIAAAISSHCARSTATIPYLAVSRTIYPGQTLVLAYDSTPEAPSPSNGYAYPFIDPALLQSTVPYLTYLTPFTYGFTPDGTLVELDDEALLAAARQGGAAPLMHLSTLTEEGGFSNELAHLASLSLRYRIRWLTIWRPCWCKRATGGWMWILNMSTPRMRGPMPHFWAASQSGSIPWAIRLSPPWPPKLPPISPEHCMRATTSPPSVRQLIRYSL